MINIHSYNLLKSHLQLGQVLHTTRRGTIYTFLGWDRNGSLRFAIPSRTQSKNPNIKSIPKEVLTGHREPHFSDCRLSVFNELQP